MRHKPNPLIFEDGQDPLPDDLPPVCCGRCSLFTRVIAKTGRCEWTPAPPAASAYGSRLTTAAEGSSCPVFRRRESSATPTADFPLFELRTEAAGPADIFDQEDR